MITIIVSIVTAAATTAVIYWYIHRNNPDVAQKAVDSVVEEAKADISDAAKAVVDEVKKV